MLPFPAARVAAWFMFGLALGLPGCTEESAPPVPLRSMTRSAPLAPAPTPTRTWVDLQPAGELTAAVDGLFLDANVGLLTSDGTWRTKDGGSTWAKVSPQGFRQLAFADAQNGFAVGGGWGGPPGIIHQTHDGGVTWTPCFTGPIGLGSLAVGDAQHVVAGAPWRGDSLWVTSDGGATWTERHGAGSDLGGTLIAAGPQEFYALNLQGQLTHSTDGGNTWTKLAKVEKRAHTGHLVLLPDRTLLLSGAGDGQLLRSTDGGQSFTPVRQAPAHCGPLKLGADGRLVLGADQGIWESTDQGRAWRRTYTTSLHVAAFDYRDGVWWTFGGAPGKVGFWPVTLLLRQGPPRPAASGDHIVPVSYTLPADGYVTLAIDDAQGLRVRNLLANQPRPRGANVDYWDGRDEWGQVVAPGSYQLRGLTHRGLHVNYAFSFNTPANPPWSNGLGTGGWGADHSNPQAVASAGGTVFLGWPMAESGNRVNAIDAATGRKLWEQGRRLTLGNHYGGVATALAADGEYVYVALQTAEAGIGFCRLAQATGKEVPFTRSENGKAINELDHVCQPQPAPAGKLPSLVALYEQRAWDAASAAGSLRGCAVDARCVYLSSYWDNAIYVCDKQTGATLKTLTLPHPAGLAADRTGGLFAISDGNLVRVDLATGTSTPVVSAGLTAPLGLALDLAGNLVVSERGAAMDLKVFSPAGRLLHTIGRPGGRAPTGPYDPSGLLMPWGVAADAQGRLWVAEEDFAPRRISVWAPTGGLVHEYIGRSTYGATGGAVNPADPTQAADTGTLFTLDWAAGSSTPVYSLPRMGWNTGAVFGWPYPGDSPVPHGKARFLRVAGHQYLLVEQTPMLVLEQVQGQWLPRAALGTLHGSMHNLWRGNTRIDLSVMPGFAAATWDMAKWPPSKAIKDYAFIWCDANGDGLVQPAEITTTDTFPGRWDSLHGGFADDLTAVLGDYQITPAGTTACGAPLYRFADCRPGVQTATVHPNGWSTWMKTPGGWLLASGYSDAWKGTPTSNIPALLGGYAPSGERRWTYPSYFQTHGSFGAPPVRRGLFIGDWYYGGSVNYGGDLGEVFHLAGNLGQHYLFTVDGLLISEVFRDARSGPLTLAAATRGVSLDDMTNGTEGWLGGFFRHPTTGRSYVLSCPGHASGPVLSELTGLETVSRLQGTVTISAAHQAQARENPPATTVRRREVGVIAQAANAPVIDGQLDDWDFARAIGIPVDERHGARVALRYDRDTLYLAYAVRDPYPLRNHGRDPHLLFKTGTAVDLMLATDPQAPPGRQAPAAGDLRLLLSVQGEQPVAVLYRPVAPGATDGSSFSSPNVRVEFASVHVLPSARIAFTRSAQGYTLEAAIPLVALGWKPVPGSPVHGDVGVIYSDDAGTRDLLRSYWSNHQTNLTEDIGEESRLLPQTWGELQVE